MTGTMTSVRNHGVAGMRDKGGVFSDAITDATQLRLERDKLMASQAELQARLQPLLAKIATDATEQELVLSEQLGEESRFLHARLQHISLALRCAEEKEASLEIDRRRKTFDRLVIEAPAKRAEFAARYRELCLLLGEICADVDEATELANQMAILSVVGLSPVDRAALDKMSAPVDPLPEILNDTYVTTKFGWNFRIAVPALRKET